MSFKNKHLALGLFGLIALAVTLHLFGQWHSDLSMIGMSFQEELINRVDLDDEQSIGTWLSVVLLFLCSFASAALASIYTGAKRGVFALLSATLLFLSIDEETTFHENVLQHLSFEYLAAAPVFIQSAWLLLLPFIAGFAVLLTILLWKYTPRRFFWMAALGATTYLLGFFGVELLTTDLESYEYIARGLSVALEEGLELSGIAIMLLALVRELPNKLSHKPPTPPCTTGN